MIKRISQIRFFPPMLALIIVSLVFLRWFLPGSFANGDIPFISLHNIKYIYGPFFWKGFHDTGIPYTESPFLLISYLASLISLTFQKTFNFLTIKILFFYPYIIFSVLGSYFLAYRITKNKISAFIASLIYSINTPILMFLSEGFTNIIVPISLFPLIFLFSIKYLEEEKVKNFLILLLIFIVESFYEFRIFYLSFICLSIFLVFNLIISRFTNLKKIFSLLFGILFFSIVANLYWILPTFLSSVNIQANPLLNRSILVIENMTVLNPLLLFHPYWTGNQIAIFTSQPIPLVFFLTGIIVIIGLFFGRKNKYVLFFGLLLIFGISLTKGLAYPFPQFFLFFFNNIPGFKVFREFHKFFFIISLPFAILATYSIRELMDQKRKFLALSFIFIIFSYLFLLVKPIVNSSIGTIFVPLHQYKNEYAAVDEYLTKNNKNNFFRVIWIPRNSSNGILSNSMPNVNLVSMEPEWRAVLKNSWSDGALSNLFSVKNIDNLFRSESIEYIVLDTDLNQEEGNLFYWYESRNVYKTNLDKANYLRKVLLPGKVSIYEVSNPSPHLFLSPITPTYKKSYPSNKVSYRQVNPTHYEIMIKSLKDKIYLNFTDDYSPDWKISLNNFSIIKSIFSQDYYLPEKYHLATDFHSNTYILDPEYIKNLKTGSYKINKDGSVDATVILTYRPQSLFYLGIIISIVTFGVFIVGLIIYEKRKN